MSEQTIAKVDTVSPLMVLGQKFSIEPSKLIEVLRGTVIKPDSKGRQATNEEVAAFCIVANQYGLNPFTREIHAFTSGEKGVVPIVGIDGWTHIVNARGEFNGCEFDEHADADGKPEAVTCRMYVKGREHPVSCTERYSECKRNTIPWTTMPWRMLRHKAYMQAARYAFGLSGIYDEDEARDITASVEVRKPIAMPKRIAPKQEQATAPAPATAEPVKATVVEPTQEVLPPAGPTRDELIAAIKPLYDAAKATKVQKVMKAVGIAWDDGAEWQQATDDQLKAMLSMMKC